MKKRSRDKGVVLLVEDQSSHMVLMGDLLEVSGYRVLKAPSGWDALRLADRRRPDLILLDIRLPDLAGTTVAPKLKANPRTRTIPVIAVTAYAMVGDKERFLESGCDGYISKPIEVEDFLRTVETFLPRLPS